MDDRAETPEITTAPIDSAADRALDADIATLTDKPATRDRAATLQWLKQRPGATFRWITHRPWLGLPLLAIFPAIAWQLDRTRPPEPETNNPAAMTSGRSQTNARGTVTPLGSLMPPVSSGQPLPLPGQPLPVPGQASPKPTTSPTLQPVDLTKLTPEQKAMNARAKAALLGASALVDSQIEMHVAIATKAPAIAVGGASPVEVADEKGNVLYNLAANEIYTAQPNGQGMTIGDQSLPPIVFLNAPTTGILLVSGRPYRGRLRLVSQGGQLWAINHVNMRNYLQSVVASEVSPDWGKESLKAQAVAARSYALTYYFKPANPLYHLGNDEYFQVYSGIEREAATTNAAVDETSGEFVSYKGGIVESLYAASDAIVMEAFQGKGMSQLGAKALANAGYKYEQILSNYYPTTAVGKIVQEF
jgi:stage II sporulation protein D